MQLSRRNVLSGCASSIGGVLLPTLAHADLSGGCFISSTQFENIRKSEEFSGSVDNLFDRNRHLRTTGDKALDKALDASIKKLSDLFGQVPAFGFYREEDHPEVGAMNAFATPENTNIPGTWGTVAFGTTLFKREMTEFDPSGSTITAIIAHEFGHIWAFRRGVMDQINSGQPTKKRSELHADYMAGYFLGTRKKANKSLKLHAAGDLFHRIGDYNFSSRGHHGTPEERVAASEQGFRVSYLEGRDAEYAFASGMEYVSTI